MSGCGRRMAGNCAVKPQLAITLMNGHSLKCWRGEIIQSLWNKALSPTTATGRPTKFQGGGCARHQHAHRIPSRSAKGHLVLYSSNMVSEGSFAVWFGPWRVWGMLNRKCLCMFKLEWKGESFPPTPRIHEHINYIIFALLVTYTRNSLRQDNGSFEMQIGREIPV